MGMIGSMQYVDGSPVPVYGFAVYQRPTYNSRMGKIAYYASVREAARREIDRPVETHDIEVEILYVTREPNRALDVDNLGKPTLDALKGVAYIDDNQIRAVRIARFDKTRPAHLSGRIGPIRALWRDDSNPHALWVFIYSATRTAELRGRRPAGWKKHVMLAPWSPGRALHS